MIGWTFGILVVLLVSFHFWFKAHAKQMLEDMVESRSKGKLKLKVKKFSFNYFSKRMKLEHVVFYTDSAGQATTYSFIIDKIELRAKAILPIVFRNEFHIDSIHLFHPDIVVTRVKPIIKDSVKKEDVSIPEEMGKVYKSIQDALKLLKVKRFEISDGIFTLVNKIDPTQLPLTISDIYFHIDNFAVDEKLTRKNKILFSDNVILNSNNQQILFPDGRHRLNFRRFNINLKKKLVEFDSCTIAATKGDSSATAFNVFFDVLQLTNIDFDTLYKAEVIKADSVFCLNPKFTLDVEVKRKGLAAGPPKLSNIIELLTGDLLLNHVVVNNADFNINTIREGVPTSFSFTNNNFEMQGLRVAQGAPKPVLVQSFSMAIRNYQNFIKDSAYSVRFDSVVFKDDRITLNNFLFNKMDKQARVINTFSIPRFTLSGLSWDDLVFENKLTADQAIMFTPYINYTASTKIRPGGSKNIFQSLGVLNEYMDLQQLDILNGTIDLKLKNSTRVQLDEATLSVKSHSLLESKKLAAIKNSLLFLRFHKGIIHAGNLDLEINDIDYSGESGAFRATDMVIKNKDKRTILNDISAKKLLVDERTGDVYGEGLTWKKADIRLDAFSGTGKNKSSIVLKDVKGGNTIINGLVNGKNIQAKLNHISFISLEQHPGKQLKLDGVALDGSDLHIKDSRLKLDAASFNLADNNRSSIQSLRFSNTTTTISIPSLIFTPHIKAILDNQLNIDDIIATKPVIEIHSPLKNQVDKETTSPLTMMNINSIRLNQPSINYTDKKDSGTLSLQWHGENRPTDFIDLRGFKSSGNTNSIRNASFYLTDFSYKGPKNESFSTGEGKLSASLKNIRIDHPENGPVEWKGNIEKFDARDLHADSLGKSKGNFKLDKASLQDLDISSALVSNLQKLVAANRSLRISQMTGSYTDSATSLKWYNAGFMRNGNNFHVDSFSVHPSITRDSFFAKKRFDVDFMNIDLGATELYQFDIEKFIEDKTIHLGLFKADHLGFTDYRDKRLPAMAKTIKPLPVSLLQSIKQKISIDSISLTNANVNYTELSKITGLAGTMPVTRMQLNLSNIRNYELDDNDSLTIVASGYLLDTAWIRLMMKESYMDSLHGFRLTVDMKPVDMTLFNSILVPLESVRIVSGYTDTLTMKAVGREYLSLGEMFLYYHDLKIQFLPLPGKKNTIWNKLKNFIANTFIVRDQNTSKAGIVFFIRDQDRSAINYLLKIAMSGIGSSVGAASNNKLTRRYKKRLDALNLPPINFKDKDKPF